MAAAAGQPPDPPVGAPGAADIAAIERATVAAVAPSACAEWPGWVLPFDGGTIGRSHSAVPLAHDSGVWAAHGSPQALVAAMAAAYRAQGLVPSLRVAHVPGLAPLQAALRAAGFSMTQPTLTMTAPWPVNADTGGGRRAAATDAARPVVDVQDQPDDAWAAVYLGEGFDPVDGACRVAALSRAVGSVYARSRAGAQGPVVATGVGSFGHGWVGVHGMRTLPAHRGQGHASAILQGLQRVAAARGVTQAFLQVEQANEGAQRLYRGVGFRPAWLYHYWRAHSG